MGEIFIVETLEELCDLMCGGPDPEDEDLTEEEENAGSRKTDAEC